MNEYFIAASFAAALAILASLFAIFVRLILAKRRPSAYQSKDSEIIANVQHKILTEIQIPKQELGQSVQYKRPDFKKNNLEEDMISRSFRIKTEANSDDEAIEHGLHLAGFTNSLHVD